MCSVVVDSGEGSVLRSTQSASGSALLPYEGRRYVGSLYLIYKVSVRPSVCLLLPMHDSTATSVGRLGQNFIQ